MQACLSRSAALLRPCTPTQRISRVAQAFRSGAPANVRSQQQRRRQHHAAAAAGDAATPESLAAVKELDQLIDELMSKRSAQELAKTVRAGGSACQTSAGLVPATAAACRRRLLPAPPSPTTLMPHPVTSRPPPCAQQVAQNIMSFDQRFWLRLATRSDAASEEEDRQQLAALAKVRASLRGMRSLRDEEAVKPAARPCCCPAQRALCRRLLPCSRQPHACVPLLLPSLAPQVVMQLVDSMVQRTNEQLNESTSLLQQILRAAADPQVLPLAAAAARGARGVVLYEGGAGAPSPPVLHEELEAGCSTREGQVLLHEELGAGCSRGQEQGGREGGSRCCCTSAHGMLLGRGAGQPASTCCSRLAPPMSPGLPLANPQTCVCISPRPRASPLPPRLQTGEWELPLPADKLAAMQVGRDQSGAGQRACY